MNDMTGNTAAWLFLGFPAILGWAAAILSWLLAPHLGVDPAPVAWGVCAILGWYGLVCLVASGWLGLIVLAGLF